VQEELSYFPDPKHSSLLSVFVGGYMRSLIGILWIAILAGAIPAKLALAQHGSCTPGGASPAGTVSSELRAAAAAAALAYDSGLHSVRRGQEYDAQALKSSTPEKAAKSRERAQAAYRESVSALIAAVTAQPSMYKAWDYLGYADRHLGNYDEALSAYAKVLELNPHNLDAIENRGEVYLDLNQIANAKSAYMDLSLDSRSQANTLMSAMRRWIELRRQDAQGVTATDIEDLAKWTVEHTPTSSR
jgi:tetratricopeptide (TPR) repeat protein